MPSIEKTRKQIKRIATGIIGGLVLIIGIIAIPYPGPGWLIVFAGLGILSTEFEWAQKILDKLKSKYDAWEAWLKKQPSWVKAIFWTATCIIVIITVWLLNGYGLINDWLNLNWDWVKSPFFK